MIDIHRWGAVASLCLLLHCGNSGSSATDVTELAGEAAGIAGSGALRVDEQTTARISGRFSSEGREIEFTARSTAPLAGDVQLRVGSLLYDVHYD